MQLTYFINRNNKNKTRTHFVMSESVHLFANAFKNSKLINFANL